MRVWGGACKVYGCMHTVQCLNTPCLANNQTVPQNCRHRVFSAQAACCEYSVLPEYPIKKKMMKRTEGLKSALLRVLHACAEKLVAMSSSVTMGTCICWHSNIIHQIGGQLQGVHKTWHKLPTLYLGPNYSMSQCISQCSLVSPSELTVIRIT